MARQNKRIEPLFTTNSQGNVTKDETQKESEVTKIDEKEEAKLKEQPEETIEDTSPEQEPETEEYEFEETESSDDYITRYKKAKPKMETHIPFNTRIPKELRRRIDIVEKYYTGGRKNTGFLQDFTENALRAELVKAEWEMIEEKRKKAKNKKPDQR